VQRKPFEGGGTLVVFESSFWFLKFDSTVSPSRTEVDGAASSSSSSSSRGGGGGKVAVMMISGRWQQPDRLSEIAGHPNQKSQHPAAFTDHSPSNPTLNPHFPTTSIPPPALSKCQWLSPVLPSTKLLCIQSSSSPWLTTTTVWPKTPSFALWAAFSAMLPRTRCLSAAAAAFVTVLFTAPAGQCNVVICGTVRRRRERPQRVVCRPQLHRVRRLFFLAFAAHSAANARDIDAGLFTAFAAK
jgi:hypothetical protein